MNDPIVDEIRQIRDAYAASFNYDLDAIFADIKKRELESKKLFRTLTAPQQSSINAPIVVSEAQVLPAKRAG